MTLRLRGWLWLGFLVLLVRLRLYVALRGFLTRSRWLHADLLTELGDHDGQLTFRKLQPYPPSWED